MAFTETAHGIGWAVALGCGLLVGLERERRKGEGPTRAAAGLRTFAVTALAGALTFTAGVTLAAADGSAVLAAAGLLVVGLLAALASWHSWRGDPADPGMTTELALVTTYLVGLMAVPFPALAAACATALALLLNLKDSLHRWATHLITAQELRDGLLLSAAVLIVLPQVPASPIQGLGGLAPRAFGLLFVLVLGVQAASHVALRAYGARAGWPLAGLLGGLVSSTAVIATLGRQARDARKPVQIKSDGLIELGTEAGAELKTGTVLLACAASSSGIATWLQIPLVVATLAPSQAPTLLPPALAGAAATAVVASWWWRRAAGVAPPGPLPAGRRVLRPREALGLATLLGMTALGVGLAQARLGSSGRLAATALAAIADAHAAVAAQAALAATQSITERQLLQGVLLAIGVNALSRTVIAWAAGGFAFAARVGLALAAGVVAAAAIAL